MDSKKQRIKRLLEELPPPQQKSILRELRERINGKSTTTGKKILRLKKDVEMEQGKRCPHCGSREVIGHGTYRGRNRYMCKKCEKTYNDLTGSPLSGTHYPEKWGPYVECMKKGLSLRETAEKLDIDVKTAFFWRHKVLEAFKRNGGDRLEGIAEADETYFLYSRKGDKSVRKDRNPRKRGGVAEKRGISDQQVPVITSCDRRGGIVARAKGRGRISSEDIDSVLSPYIGEEGLLCTDGHRSYRSYAESRDIALKEVCQSNGERVREGIYHIQNINGYHSRLKKWIKRFNGVATKYLNNYMSWFRVFEKTKHAADRIKEMLRYALQYPGIMTTSDVTRGDPQYLGI